MLISDVHYDILGPFWAARPASYRPAAWQENILPGRKKSARQRAESDVIEIKIKPFRWLISVAFGDDVEPPEKET